MERATRLAKVWGLFMTSASRFFAMFVLASGPAAFAAATVPTPASGPPFASGPLRNTGKAGGVAPATSVGGAAACSNAAYRTYGIDFSPYEDGQNPNVNPTVSRAQILARMQIVAPCTTWVRTFSVTHGLEVAGEVAHGLGLKIAAGAWLSGDLQANDREIASLIALGQAGQADLLIVGSEAMLRHDVTDAQLIGYINQVKQAVPSLPVGTADVWDVLLLHQGVIAASDVVLVNYYPYWNGIPVDKAMTNVNNWHSLVTAAAGGRPVIVSETGWPSDGNAVLNAVPSPANASYYFLDFVSWARAKNVNYFYFEGFDEAWKAPYEGPQGAHWGLFDSDGNLKPGFEQVVNGVTLLNNWDCSGTVGGAGSPSIDLTYVPPYGSSMNLAGQIAHVSPDAYEVVVYLSVNGGATWYVKPYLTAPITYTQCDGTWTTNVVTGGSDQLATNYAAFLIPRTYSPPVLSGAPLPGELFQNAAATAQVSRSTTSISGTIRDRSGNAIDGQVILSGAEAQTVVSVGGTYSFFHLATSGPFTVTPSAPGYTFTPSSQSFPTVAGAQTASFEGTASTDLSVSMTAVPDGAVVVGNVLDYQIRVANAGPGSASSVVLSDVLPAGTSFVSVQTDSGSCSGTQIVTCTIGTLPRGAWANATLRVQVLAPGTIVNSVAVTGAEPDPDSSNNEASVTVPVITPLTGASAVTLAKSDFDGDGRTDVAVYRPATGEWFIRYSSLGYVVGAGAWYFQWGLPGDIPMPGDFDGDGKTDLVVYRATTGEWFIRYSSLGYVVGAGAWYFQWGLPADTPIAADFDGDKKTDPAVYRPTTGEWFIRYSSQNYVVGAGSWSFQWGLPGDTPNAADFDGDGRTDLAVYRPSTGDWFQRLSSQGYVVGAGPWYFQWGLAGDRQMRGDFDGDGKTDIAVYRPTTGEWYIRSSSLTYVVGAGNWYFQWGLVGDAALPTP